MQQPKMGEGLKEEWLEPELQKAPHCPGIARYCLCALRIGLELFPR